MKPRIYDFSHWPELPFVSCQCITYGRTTLLDESVECFLRQDYAGPKELVILNDLPELLIECDLPDVRVVNLPFRMKSIGEKRNACVAMCRGDVIFVWDDDDISLSHRVSFSLQQMTNHRYFKAGQFWYWKDGVLSPEPKKGVVHPMGCWATALFDEVNGYPHIQSGQDAGLEEKFRGRGRYVEQLDPDDIYYLYRFPGTGSYHLSAFGFGKGFSEVASYVSRKSIGGRHRIEPRWLADYEQLAADAATAWKARAQD